MDNTNSISESVVAPVSFNESPYMETESSGFFDSLKSINMTTWLIIILILAFLGFNIFVYLAKGTESVSSFLQPIFEKLFGATVTTTEQTISVSAEGAKEVVSGTAGAVNAGLSAVQDVVTPGHVPSSAVKGAALSHQRDTVQETTLNKALDHSEQNASGYEADSANSSIQGGGKAGWCYIGMDRGFRSCAEISASDTCMSGNIFPSQEICMNPTLRP